jgi:hypothetical protein
VIALLKNVRNILDQVALDRLLPVGLVVRTRLEGECHGLHLCSQQQAIWTRELHLVQLLLSSRELITESADARLEIVAGRHLREFMGGTIYCGCSAFNFIAKKMRICVVLVWARSLSFLFLAQLLWNVIREGCVIAEDAGDDDLLRARILWQFVPRPKSLERLGWVHVEKAHTPESICEISLGLFLEIAGRLAFVHNGLKVGGCRGRHKRLTDLAELTEHIRSNLRLLPEEVCFLPESLLLLTWGLPAAALELQLMTLLAESGVSLIHLLAELVEVVMPEAKEDVLHHRVNLLAGNGKAAEQMGDVVLRAELLSEELIPLKARSVLIARLVCLAPVENHAVKAAVKLCERRRRQELGLSFLVQGPPVQRLVPRVEILQLRDHRVAELGKCVRKSEDHLRQRNGLVRVGVVGRCVGYGHFVLE